MIYFAQAFIDNPANNDILHNPSRCAKMKLTCGSVCGPRVGRFHRQVGSLWDSVAGRLRHLAAYPKSLGWKISGVVQSLIKAGCEKNETIP